MISTISQILDLMSKPVFWVGLGVGLTLLLCYYAFAAYVGSLDVPPKGTPEYRRWKFLNLLAANLKRAAKAGRIPVNGSTRVSLNEEEARTIEEVRKMTVGGE